MSRPAPQHEGVGVVHAVRDPLRLAGREVGAADGRVVAAGPAAERDLQADHRQGDRGGALAPSPPASRSRPAAAARPGAAPSMSSHSQNSSDTVDSPPIRCSTTTSGFEPPDRECAEQALQQHRAEQRQRERQADGLLAAVDDRDRRDQHDHEAERGRRGITMDHLARPCPSRTPSPANTTRSGPGLHRGRRRDGRSRSASPGSRGRRR